MERLLTKRYELNIKIKSWIFTKTIKLEFDQAKLIDTVEFMKINKEGSVGIIIWMLKFIKVKSGVTLTKTQRNYVMRNWKPIFEQIKDTFFEGCFASKEQGSKQEMDESPFSAYITMLSEKIGLDPIELASKYTPKQLEFICEGLVRNANESTKEGQKKNILWLRKQKALNRSDEEKEKIKEILSGLHK